MADDILGDARSSDPDRKITHEEAAAIGSPIFIAEKNAYPGYDTRQPYTGYHPTMGYYWESKGNPFYETNRPVVFVDRTPAEEGDEKSQRYNQAIKEGKIHVVLEPKTLQELQFNQLAFDAYDKGRDTSSLTTGQKELIQKFPFIEGGVYNKFTEEQKFKKQQAAFFDAAQRGNVQVIADPKTEQGRQFNQASFDTFVQSGMKITQEQALTPVQQDLLQSTPQLKERIFDPDKITYIEPTPEQQAAFTSDLNTALYEGKVSFIADPQTAAEEKFNEESMRLFSADTTPDTKIPYSDIQKDLITKNPNLEDRIFDPIQSQQLDTTVSPDTRTSVSFDGIPVQRGPRQNYPKPKSDPLNAVVMLQSTPVYAQKITTTKDGSTVIETDTFPVAYDNKAVTLRDIKYGDEFAPINNIAWSDINFAGPIGGFNPVEAARGTWNKLVEGGKNIGKHAKLENNPQAGIRSNFNQPRTPSPVPERKPGVLDAYFLNPFNPLDLADKQVQSDLQRRDQLFNEFHGKESGFVPTKDNKFAYAIDYSVGVPTVLYDPDHPDRTKEEDKAFKESVKNYQGSLRHEYKMENLRRQAHPYLFPEESQYSSNPVSQASEQLATNLQAYKKNRPTEFATPFHEAFYDLGGHSASGGMELMSFGTMIVDTFEVAARTEGAALGRGWSDQDKIDYATNLQKEKLQKPFFYPLTPMNIGIEKAIDQTFSEKPKDDSYYESQWNTMQNRYGNYAVGGTVMALGFDLASGGGSLAARGLARAGFSFVRHTVPYTGREAVTGIAFRGTPIISRYIKSVGGLSRAQVKAVDRDTGKIAVNPKTGESPVFNMLIPEQVKHGWKVGGTPDLPERLYRISKMNTPDTPDTKFGMVDELSDYKIYLHNVGTMDRAGLTPVMWAKIIKDRQEDARDVLLAEKHYRKKIPLGPMGFDPKIADPSQAVNVLKSVSEAQAPRSSRLKRRGIENVPTPKLGPIYGELNVGTRLASYPPAKEVTAMAVSPKASNVSPLEHLASRIGPAYDNKIKATHDSLSVLSGDVTDNVGRRLVSIAGSDPSRLVNPMAPKDSWKFAGQKPDMSKKVSLPMLFGGTVYGLRMREELLMAARESSQFITKKGALTELELGKLDAIGSTKGYNVEKLFGGKKRPEFPDTKQGWEEWRAAGQKRMDWGVREYTAGLKTGDVGQLKRGLKIIKHAKENMDDIPYLEGYYGGKKIAPVPNTPQGWEAVRKFGLARYQRGLEEYQEGLRFGNKKQIERGARLLKHAREDREMFPFLDWEGTAPALRLDDVEQLFPESFLGDYSKTASQFKMKHTVPPLVDPRMAPATAASFAEVLTSKYAIPERQAVKDLKIPRRAPMGLKRIYHKGDERLESGDMFFPSPVKKAPEPKPGKRSPIKKNIFDQDHAVPGLGALGPTPVQHLRTRPGVGTRARLDRNILPASSTKTKTKPLAGASVWTINYEDIQYPPKTVDMSTRLQRSAQTAGQKPVSSTRIDTDSFLGSRQRLGALGALDTLQGQRSLLRTKQQQLQKSMLKTKQLQIARTRQKLRQKLKTVQKLKRVRPLVRVAAPRIRTPVIGFLPDVGTEKPKKSKQTSKQNIDHIGNVPEVQIVGIYKRPTTIYGRKKVSRLERKDQQRIKKNVIFEGISTPIHKSLKRIPKKPNPISNPVKSSLMGKTIKPARPKKNKTLPSLFGETPQKVAKQPKLLAPGQKPRKKKAKDRPFASQALPSKTNVFGRPIRKTKFRI